MLILFFIRSSQDIKGRSAGPFFVIATIHGHRFTSSPAAPEEPFPNSQM